MTFLTVYLIALGIAMSVWGFNTWYEMKYPNPVAPPDTITLGTLAFFFFVCVCPIINVFAALIGIWYFFSEIANRIVIFGGGK